MISLDVAKRLAQALRPAKPDVAEVSGGTVTRIENDGTVWVQLYGAEDDTPCTSQTAAAQVGDAVTVTINGGSARLDGNVTRPATDDERADEAHELAAQASEEVAEVRKNATVTARLLATARSIADEARAVAKATGQHFFADDNGIHVTEADGDPTTEHNILINSLGILLRQALNPLVSVTQSAIAFYDGLGDAAANVVASFGADSAQIGKSDESHVVVTNRSMTMRDAGGGEYVRMSASGTPTPAGTFTWTGDGSTTRFNITPSSSRPSSSVSVPSCVITVDGEKIYEGANVLWTASVSNGTVTLTVRGVLFESAPASGAAISLSVTFGSVHAVRLGATNDAYATGDTSVAEGIGTIPLGVASHAEGVSSSASGAASHAEGMFSAASGAASHAEGESTDATGRNSHAEGESTDASGVNSHAGGLGTVASSDNQTVIGKMNVEDANGIYAFIIGNGADALNRSNAFAVRWDGTMEAAKPLPVASGGTGSTGFGTIETTDISTAVAVPSASWTALGSVTLAVGDWIVSYNVQFGVNATGRRGMLIHTTADATSPANLRQGGVEVMAVDGGATMLNGCRVLHLTSAATYYLNVIQSSGADLNAIGYIRAYRLK